MARSEKSPRSFHIVLTLAEWARVFGVFKNAANTTKPTPTARALIIAGAEYCRKKYGGDFKAMLEAEKIYLGGEPLQEPESPELPSPTESKKEGKDKGHGRHLRSKTA